MIKVLLKSGLITLLLIYANFEQSKAQRVSSLSSKFRIIGYLRVTDIEKDNAASFDFGKINYLNIAFINPDAGGNFAVKPNLNKVVANAHDKKVKVLASLGGGLAPAYYSLLLSDDKRSYLIRNLVQFVMDNQLDGVDVDLEGERIDANYDDFISELSEALVPLNKLLTAAIATAYKSSYSDKALSLFNFVNIMSYDKTGPWKPENPGQHSPYNMAVEDLDYWTNTRGINKEKLNLGMPFYGYGFGQGAPVSMTFDEIVNLYSGSANQDDVTVAEGGTIYYNGIATIKNKTKLALQRAGGIMVWQLLQDAKGEKSLLNTINTVVNNYRH